MALKDWKLINRKKPRRGYVRKDNPFVGYLVYKENGIWKVLITSKKLRRYLKKFRSYKEISEWGLRYRKTH